MTLCDLYKWEVEDGPSFHLTSAQVAITYDGDTYEPTPMRRAALAVNGSGNGAKQKSEVQLPVSHDIAELWGDPPTMGAVTLTVTQVEYDDPDGTARTLAVARVAGSKMEGNALMLEVQPVGTEEIRLPRGAYSTRCRWALYSRGCGVEESSHDYLFHVVSRDIPHRQIVVSPVAGVPSWMLEAHALAGGFIRAAETTTPYDPTGERRLISRQPEPVLVSVLNETYEYTLTLNAWTDDIASEATTRLRVYPGCPKTIEACQARFANVDNFGGFPTLTSVRNSPFFDGFWR